MNILHYDYFIAIAENKTLTQAAHALHVSQSVLSRYLQNLETDTGIRLFATASGSYELTEAGTLYLKSARKIQFLQSQLHQKLNGARTPNLLRFGIPPIRGGASLAYIYPHMLERYPSLHVSVINERSTLLYQKLLAGFHPSDDRRQDGPEAFGCSLFATGKKTNSDGDSQLPCPVCTGRNGHRTFRFIYRGFRFNERCPLHSS